MANFVLQQLCLVASETRGLQSWKYLVSGPLQKKIIDSWYNIVERKNPDFGVRVKWI